MKTRKQPLLPMAATAIDHELAADFCRISGTPKKGECWRNSVMAMAGYPDPLGITYVEGWLLLIDGEVAAEHGWLVVGDKVVDVTLTGEFEAGAYYGVFSYTFDEVGSLVKEHGRLPFYGNYRQGKETMREAFKHLPLEHGSALLWAYLARAVTGIESVMIEHE